MASIDRDRVRAVLGVAVLHVLLGYAFLTGLAFEVVREAGQGLKIFEVPEPVPPPPVEEPRPIEARAPEPEGAAAPANLKANPTPVVAPPPKIELEVPTPVVAAPKATPLAPGPDPSAGASNQPGPGWGAGGQGVGTGSGASGSGAGGGGGGRVAQHLRGRISNSDYPRSLERAQLGGAVVVRYTIMPSGRAQLCTVLRSSGFAELDQRTCALIERRYRYRPALDSSGRPVAEEMVATFDWWVPSRGPNLRRP